MPVGFEIYNDFGSLQLSSNLMQYYLRKTGTCVLNNSSLFSPVDGSYNPGGSDRFTYTLYDDNLNYLGIPAVEGEFVALSSPEPLIYESPFPITRSFNSPTIKYYIFAPYSTLPTSTSNLGLQIFNAAGQLTFDLTKKPMIVAKRHLVGSLYAGMDVPVGLPGGREYAVVYNASSFRVTQQLPADSSIYTPNFNAAGVAFRMAGGDVRLTEFPRYNYASVSSAEGILTILDVTGY